VTAKFEQCCRNVIDPARQQAVIASLQQLTSPGHDVVEIWASLCNWSLGAQNQHAA
jgi:hypothetical protein